MTQDQLRYGLAAIVAVTLLWTVGYSLFLRGRGVMVAALAQSGTNWVQRALVAGGAAFGAYLVARAPFPALDERVMAGPSPLPVLSAGLAAVGAAVIAASQIGMGRSWRVGVPAGEGHVDELVTAGLHRLSRNPTYLGAMLLLFGAALAAPGPLSLAVPIMAYFGLTIIIRQEERYLRDRFGERYEEYAAKVRRWI